MTSNAALKPNVEDLEAQDRAYMFHPSTHLKNHAHGRAPCRIMADGEGVYVTDRDGRQSLLGRAPPKRVKVRGWEERSPIALHDFET